MRGRPYHVSFRVGLAAVTALGAAIRLTLLWSKWDRPLLLNDSLYYSVQASRLVRGDWFGPPFEGLSGAEHGPLTTLVLAPFSMSDAPVNWQRVATTLCGIATVAVVGLVGRRVGGPRVGLAAAAVAAVYPNLWISDGLVMSESLACLVVAVTLLQLLRWLDGAGSGAAVWCGVALGLGALTRSEIALFAPVMLGVVWWSGRRRRAASAWGQIAACAAVAVAVTAPWSAFNLSRYEHPVLLTTNESQVLVGANCDDSYYRSVGGWSLFCVTELPPVAGEDPSERAVRQRRHALAYARRHWERLPIVAVARVGRTLDLYGLRDMVDGDVGEERPRWAAWAGIASFWVAAPLAATGLLRVRRRDRAVLLVPCVVVLVTTVAFYGAHRIRSTAEPAIVVAAAVALAGRTRRRHPAADAAVRP